MRKNFSTIALVSLLTVVPVLGGCAAMSASRLRPAFRGLLLSDGSNIYPISQNLPAKTRDGFRITAASDTPPRRCFPVPFRC